MSMKKAGGNSHRSNSASLSHLADLEATVKSKANWTNIQDIVKLTFQKAVACISEIENKQCKL